MRRQHTSRPTLLALLGALAIVTISALTLHLSASGAAHAAALVGTPPTATATFVPTATSIPITTAAATPTPADSAMAGPMAPLVMSLNVNMNVTAQPGAKRQYNQALQIFMPTGAVTTGVSMQVSVPPLGGVPELTGQAGEQNNAGIGMVFDVNATDPRTGQRVHHLERGHPMVLQFTYDPTQVAGIDPHTLRVCYFDGHDWLPLPTTLDLYHHVLTATTDHFTLFAVRVTARTQAQITRARTRLAALSAAGPPQVSVLPVAQTTVGGLPLVITVPAGRQQAPLSVQVTGGPRTQVRIAFTLETGAVIVQTLALDRQGYATTAFVPSLPLSAAQQLSVVVTVTHRGEQATTTRTVTLLPGMTAGPLPPGAPALRATLSVATVQAGAPGPLLTVMTAPGATVRAALRLAGTPLDGLHNVEGTAGSHGGILLHLPAIARALLDASGQKTGGVTHVRIVVTATLHGESTQLSVPLDVTR